MLSQLWNFIKIRFKTKIAIFAIVLFGAYLFHIIPFESVRFSCLLITIGFIPVMALVITLDSIKTVSMLFATMFKKKITIDAPDEVLQLAKKIGVSCRQFNIILDFDNAYVTPSGNVNVGDKLLAALSRDELLGVFAHEFGHHKKRHLLKRIPIVFLIFVLGYLASMQLPSIIMAYAFFAFVSIAMIPFSWDAEFEADRIAKETGLGESLISAFEKISNGRDIHEGSESHPPISKRIAALRK